MSAGEAKHDSPRTSRNASDAWRRSEKGRHDRNATVFVMFEKKLKHDKLEKFWLKDESNGCGNGVGRTGGEEGMVGTVWAEMGISEVDAGAAEDAAPDPVRDAAEAD
jgi:hypothetical protein